MKLKKSQYSENFWDYEFNYVEPEPMLLTVLERLRVKMGGPIIITSGPRTVESHIEIYKKFENNGKLDGKKWYEAIPWGSRHLPAHGQKLRAADFCVVKRPIKLNEPKENFNGEVILANLLEIEKETEVPLGIGVGRRYCHVDIDRKKPTVWYYKD